MRTKNGFTIIELTVVVAIIGLIAAVALGLFAKPKANSRDARREKDIKEIRTGLGLYVNAVGTYPVCSLGPLVDNTCSGASLESILRAQGAMSATPRDPLDSGTCAGFVSTSFRYCYESVAGADYGLYYHLETNTISNPSGAAVPGAPGWYFISP